MINRKLLLHKGTVRAGVRTAVVTTDVYHRRYFHLGPRTQNQVALLGVRFIRTSTILAAPHADSY